MHAPLYDRIAVYERTLARYADAPTRRPDFVLTELAPAPAFAAAPPPRIQFEQADTLDAARALQAAGYNPLALNMSDWRVPGGAVTAGSSAQEEELFRRSDYHKALPADLYPMSRLQTVVSRGVEVWCAGAAAGYVPLASPYRVDMVAAPAPRFPALDFRTGAFADPADVALLEDKIRMLVQAAGRAGNDALVLGAWGCGAFGCPPRQVAAIFHRILTREPPPATLRLVLFAILGANYALFREGWDAAAAAAV